MNTSFKVDISPDMNMYKLLQSQSYSVYSALSEFVDNSVQSYIDHKDTIQKTDKNNENLKIKISIDSKNKEITILDNAHGINRKNFQKAIKMNVDTSHKNTSLSKFGVGMKTAAIWFSSYWKIETSALGSDKKLICKFDLDQLLNTGEKKVSVSCLDENIKSHYTKITIKKSPRIEPKQYYKEKVLPHLAETFIKFNDFLSIDINYDKETLEKTDKAYFKPLEPLNYPEVNNRGDKKNNRYKKWIKKVQLTYKNQQVKASFRIMKKGSYSHPGIRLFRNRRVIEGTLIDPNRPKILLETKNKYASQRLYGEIHLDNFEVNFMKTKFIDDLTPLYDSLKQELQKDRFIDQVKNYRSKKSQENPQEIIETSKETSDDIVIRTPGGQTKKKRALNAITHDITHDITNNINRTKIEKHELIDLKLSNLQKPKLHSLYKSLCKISLIRHPYLAYIGSWAFFEGLSILMKKNTRESFTAFFNNKSNEWYNDREKKKRIQNAIKEIHAKGNFSKHDPEYDFSDAKQLHHEFKILEKFIVKCIDNIQDN